MSTGNPFRVIGGPSSLQASAVAANVGERTVERWMVDFRNNEGWFSPSRWGTNTKVPSLLGDVETQLWTRSWIIENMGLRSGCKNKTADDYAKAVHKKLGLEWHDEVELRIVKPSAILAALHKAGAEYSPVGCGNTFHDSHGADHVAKVQRPLFLKLYQQFYDRGPNFVRLPDGTYKDKDLIDNLYESGLLDHAECQGPRGINLGGCINPANQAVVCELAGAVDRPGKVWISMCHDECCVHSLKEEKMAWIIPGIEMGDMPKKSDGDICHLSEADGEFGPGCLSLTGAPGMISRTTMREYLRAKRAGENPLVPHHATVYMHAGGANEGSWEGDDANDHMELLQDMFDVVFNLEAELPDMKAARANDLLAITPERRAAFKYGLVMQIDRSQGHMKRPPCGLNTKNPPGINKGPGGKQPHFRHTFAPLPDGHTEWRTCRQALCHPTCRVCAEAVVRFGHIATFQSVGYKGSARVLDEMGINRRGLGAAECAELLNAQPNWGQKVSQLQETFMSRGNCTLVGAACHAELAYKEHGWARLKAKVRPHVDGKYSTLWGLIDDAVKAIGLKARLEDARRSREVMKAYRSLAENDEVVTEESLKLWEKKHKMHRSVHQSEIADLQNSTGMAISEKDKRLLKKMKSTEENKKIRDKLNAAHLKKLRSLFKSNSNRKYYDGCAREKAASRLKEHKAKPTVAKKPVRLNGRCPNVSDS